MYTLPAYMRVPGGALPLIPPEGGYPRTRPCTAVHPWTVHWSDVHCTQGPVLMAMSLVAVCFDAGPDVCIWVSSPLISFGPILCLSRSFPRQGSGFAESSKCGFAGLFPNVDGTLCCCPRWPVTGSPVGHLSCSGVPSLPCTIDVCGVCPCPLTLLSRPWWDFVKWTFSLL